MMTNGEKLDALLKDISEGKHPGQSLEESKILAAWLLEDSLPRMASFLFIAETIFVKHPDIYSSIHRKVLTSFLVEMMSDFTADAEDELTKKKLENMEIKPDTKKH